jgi:hypothetical protein
MVRVSKNLSVGIFLTSTALSAPAFAQYVPPADVPPVHSSTDELNVDLVTRNIAAEVGGVDQHRPGWTRRPQVCLDEQ